MFALLLSAVAMIPSDAVVLDEADVIEVNHYFDKDGNLVFKQVIFWRWRNDSANHHVFAWRFAKQSSQIPVHDWARNGYVSIWYDGQVLRCVRSRAIRETWTQYDPEVHDRTLFCQRRRCGLLKNFPSDDAKTHRR